MRYSTAPLTRRRATMHSTSKMLWSSDAAASARLRFLCPAHREGRRLGLPASQGKGSCSADGRAASRSRDNKPSPHHYRCAGALSKAARGGCPAPAPRGDEGKHRSSRDVATTSGAQGPIYSTCAKNRDLGAPAIAIASLSSYYGRRSKYLYLIG